MLSAPDPAAHRAAPTRERPLHTRPWALALVLIGGTAGTAARQAVNLVIPETASLPLALLVCNLLGALLLGVLLEALAQVGEDHRPGRSLRLLLGTGFLGAFTSYSALALVLAIPLAPGGVPGAPMLPVALGYGLLTVIGGLLAAALGIALTARLHRMRASR